MKRFIVIPMLVLCVTLGYAQNYTSSQESLRKEISSFLSRKNYSPENQNDGLKFKMEGDTYYVEIDETDKSPMFLRVRRYIKYDDKITHDKVFDEQGSTNLLYSSKIICDEKRFILSYDMFLSSSSEFTSIFDEIMEQITGMYYWVCL